MDGVIATKRIWAAKPLLVAYVVAIGFTIGLLVDRTPRGEQAVPALGGSQSTAHESGEREALEPPLWLQLFRPSQPTARMMLRLGLPILTIADGSAQEIASRNLAIYIARGAEEQPQTLFQAMLPFLRPNRPPVVSLPPPPPVPDLPLPTPNGGKAPPAPASPPPPKREIPPPATPSGAVNGGLPIVGIYHTHDWESYKSEFPALALHAKPDLDKVKSESHAVRTVMEIGRTLAERLQAAGVTTVWADATHQSLGYQYAYVASRETANKILKDHPSVKILLDLHRDGTWGLDATTVIEGKRVAQIRCIVGKKDEPHWQQNQAFCDQLMERLERKHPGISLPTRVQEDRYNQDLMTGAILLEIGNALNNYDEAERATSYLAEGLAELIRDGTYPH